MKLENLIMDLASEKTPEAQIVAWIFSTNRLISRWARMDDRTLEGARAFVQSIAPSYERAFKNKGALDGVKEQKKAAALLLRITKIGIERLSPSRKKLSSKPCSCQKNH